MPARPAARATLDPPGPDHRITAGVEACDDRDLILRHAEENAVGKSTQLGAPHILKSQGELKRILGNPDDLCIQRLQKAQTKAGDLTLVPVLCRSHLLPGGRQKYDPTAQGTRLPNSTLNSDQSMPSARS
jgi:hypothetical protein